MKNMTLSADNELIKRARLLAKSQNKTLNALLREWLDQLVSQNSNAQEYEGLMNRLKHVNAGEHFSRDKMNTNAKLFGLSWFLTRSLWPQQLIRRSCHEFVWNADWKSAVRPVTIFGLAWWAPSRY